MIEKKEFETMIEVLTLAIARQEAEEQFFRRSAEKSTSETAQTLFGEIARDFQHYRETLEERKRDILRPSEGGPGT